MYFQSFPKLCSSCIKVRCSFVCANGDVHICAQLRKLQIRYVRNVTSVNLVVRIIIVKISEVGGKCAVRSDCVTTSGAPVSCVRSVCECHQDYHPNAASDDCIKNVGNGIFSTVNPTFYIRYSNDI
jgi:hypothetical protein